MNARFASRLARPFALGALLLAGACASSSLPAGDRIGQPIEARSILPLATLAATPDAYVNQTLLVEATVDAVCQSRGCWMKIADGSATAMVRWESGCGGQFAFPKDSVGKRVVIQGSWYPKEISEEDAKHLESESGGKPMPRKTWEMNASGVIVRAP